MITISLDDIKDVDNLDRPLLRYSVAKRNGVKKGVAFNTDCGPLTAVEYIDWNTRTNRRFSGFACVETN